MTTLKKINNEIVQSMKNKEVERLAAFKQIKTFLVKAQKDNAKSEDDETFAFETLQLFVKQKDNTIQSFEKLKGKVTVDDRITEENLEKELAISLLPEDIQAVLNAKSLGKDETKEIIEKIISDNGYSSMQDMKAVMEALKEIPGVDMKSASGIARTLLN